jgi:hypothetical protein
MIGQRSAPISPGTSGPDLGGDRCAGPIRSRRPASEAQEPATRTQPTNQIAGQQFPAERPVQDLGDPAKDSNVGQPVSRTRPGPLHPHRPPVTASAPSLGDSVGTVARDRVRVPVATATVGLAVLSRADLGIRRAG